MNTTLKITGLLLLTIVLGCRKNNGNMIHQSSEGVLQLKTSQEIVDEAIDVAANHNSALDIVKNSSNFPYSSEVALVQDIIDQIEIELGTSINVNKSFYEDLLPQNQSASIMIDAADDGFNQSIFSTNERDIYYRISDTLFGDTSNIKRGLNNIINDVLAGSFTDSEKQRMVNTCMIASYSYAYWTKEFRNSSSQWTMLWDGPPPTSDITGPWRWLYDTVGYVVGFVQEGHEGGVLGARVNSSGH